jgi:hypothetical protein
MTEPEKSQLETFGELVAAVGKLLIWLGVLGVFAFVAWALMSG